MKLVTFIDGGNTPQAEARSCRAAPRSSTCRLPTRRSITSRPKRSPACWQLSKAAPLRLMSHPRPSRPRARHPTKSTSAATSSCSHRSHSRRRCATSCASRSISCKRSSRRASCARQVRPTRTPRCARWKRTASSWCRRSGTSGRSATTLNRLCVIGTDTDVVWPAYCQAFDFEPGVRLLHRQVRPRHHARERAAAHRRLRSSDDFSARDQQTGNARPAQARARANFDGGNPMVIPRPPTRSATLPARHGGARGW